jgi:2-dehydro-3-deoxy-D-arabinonate dehydratase
VSALWRVRTDVGVRLARGPVEAGPTQLLAGFGVGEVLAEAGGVARALEAEAAGPVPDDAGLVAPLDEQEVWAAGVTYLRSRDARMEESDTPDHYDRVYVADRPELFVKATPGRIRGPGERVCIRGDSTWDVPEPELTVIADASGEIVAYTSGNDVSSRSIEGENPLYLPQAKVYRGSGAVGPALVPVAAAPSLDGMEVRLEIRRRGPVVYEDTVRVADLRRSPEELVGWLFRCQEFPRGVALMTGTGLVPDPDFSLEAADEVTITITGLGSLSNVVERIAV